MDYFKEVLKGVLIGVANIVPGVSGGTLAISMGIYDRIIRAVTHIAKDTKESVRTLFPYGLGAVIGVVGLSFVIEFLFETFPLQTSLTFVGLILGGIPIIASRLKGRHVGLSGTAACAFTFFLMTVMAFMEGAGTHEVVLTIEVPSLISLFFVGMIAAATMVVPGVSGTMILMMLGYYQPVIAAINKFILAAVSADFQAMILEGLLLMPFALGVLAGIFACAKLIEILLSRYEIITYSAIIGLVLSSPLVILSGVNLGGIHIPTVLSGLVCFGLAAAFAARLSKNSSV